MLPPPGGPMKWSFLWIRGDGTASGKAATEQKLINITLRLYWKYRFHRRLSSSFYKRINVEKDSFLKTGDRFESDASISLMEMYNLYFTVPVRRTESGAELIKMIKIMLQNVAPFPRRPEAPLRRRRPRRADDGADEIYSRLEFAKGK